MQVNLWALGLGLLVLAGGPSIGCAGTQTGERKPAVAPEPIREYVDTTLRPSSGRTLHVAAGGDLQDAIDVAQPGDTIVLEAGATFQGPFSLPNKKSGTGWITIQSSSVGRNFPPPGTRVTPSSVPLMATLTAGRGAIVTADKGAHHYRFIGLELRPEEGTYLNSLMWFGANRERSLEEQPHHLIIDRCYLHGDPRKGSRRGVTMNGRHQAVIDSYVSDFKDERADSQALVGWSGAGPFKIVNNYLEGAGENLNFGGGDPIIRDLVPSDIEIRQNHLAKPLTWKKGEPGYDGSSWMVKNLFELKNARRVVFDGNVLEHSWADAQSGFAVLLTVRNQDGRAPWSVIEDVQFTNNIVRHSGSGITLMGHDNNRPREDSQETKRVLIKNNVWEDIGTERWGGKGILFQLVEGTSDVVIENNTGLQSGFLVYTEGPPNSRFVFRRNIAPHNEYGIFGRDVGTGERAIAFYFPDAIVSDNVIVGGDDRQYPKGNAFPASLDVVPFRNLKGGDYRMAGSVSTDRASDRTGADVAAICAALSAGAETERICRQGGLAGARP